MLEKPDIPDELIISRLQDDYDLRVAELTFLPIGADLRTAVYRVVTDDGTAYFLKLRRNFKEIIVRVPLFLKDNGIQAVIVPLETRSKQRWADFGEYKLILHPFIQGKDGFDRELSDHHRRTLGTALKRIHTAQVPPGLKRLIPQETFSPGWRESLKLFLARIENKNFDDTTAVKLAEFMKSKRNEINRLVERAEHLPQNFNPNLWNWSCATRTFTAATS